MEKNSSDENQDNSSQPLGCLAADEASDGQTGLLPCPCCGKQPRIDLTTWGYYAVRCVYPPCRMSGYHRKKRQWAIAAWNTRANSRAQLLAERDALQSTTGGLTCPCCQRNAELLVNGFCNECATTRQPGEIGLNLFRQLVGGKNALRQLDVFACNFGEHEADCECFWEQCEAWAKTHRDNTAASAGTAEQSG